MEAITHDEYFGPQGRLGRWARSLRHPARMVAMALSALAVTWGVGSDAAIASAMLAAAFGVAAGEVLARTRIRTPFLILGLLGLAAAGGWFSHALTHTRVLAAMFGPASALNLSAMLRFAVLAGTATCLLRLTAVRWPAMLGVELAVSAACVAVLFAAHREGVIARPLWLSDWAWRHGYQPQEVLKGIGGVAVIVMGGLMIAESKRELTVVSLLTLPALAVAALYFFDLDPPKPKPANDLGLVESTVGDPPLPTDEGGYGPGGGQDQDPNSQGTEGQEQNPQTSGGGQGQQPQDPDGSGSGGSTQMPETSGGGDQGQEQQGQGQGQGQEQQQGQGQGQGQQQQQQQGQGQGQQQQPPNVDDMQPNSGQKPAPMAVVILGDDYEPPLGAWYFRQDTWSDFNGSRLTRARRGDVDQDLIKSFPTREVTPREPPTDKLRTLVHAKVAMVIQHVRPFALESVSKMAPAKNPNPKQFWRAYEFEAMAPTYGPRDLEGMKAGNPAWDQEIWNHYLELPQDTRYRELAYKIVGDLPDVKKADPWIQAVAVKLWMDEHLSYSTAERHAGVADPTADFLFGNRIGYCVHFAHAAVYMWRSLGIPARVATGYHITEDERTGSSILIRGGDAHAWPELYLEGVGWVVLDIAARENLDPPGTPMDDDLAQELADLAREEPESIPHSKDDEGKTKPKRDGSFLQDLARTTLWLFGLAFVGLHGIKIWRRFAPRYATKTAMPRVGYRLGLDLLSEIGVSRKWGESREGFAKRVHDRFPSLEPLTAMHVAAHMRDPDRDRASAPEYRAAAWDKGIGALRGEVKAAAPLWRRVLGMLDPTSFFRSR